MIIEGRARSAFGVIDFAGALGAGEDWNGFFLLGAGYVAVRLF